MAGTKDQIKGKANEAVGAARKKTGQATGNQKMEAKGSVQQVKGKAQGIVGKAKRKLS
jgi:uncharacterized protein YjbJ (UPF0337 family)